MAAGGNAHLTIYDAQSWTPLANAHVTAVGPDKRTVQRLTDKNGVADLHALATGTWTLDVRLAGYANVEKTLAIPGGDVRIELARGARVAGVVRDRFGRRLGGARVVIGTLAVQADSDGNFMLSDAPTGEVTISAESGDLHAAQSLSLAPGDDRCGVELEATAG
jgi:hypothetical protein